MNSSAIKTTFGVCALAAASLFSTASYATGNTCVYVLGTVNGRTITTPAVAVVVPASSVALGPLRVHVDPTTQNVLGYHIAVPGVDESTPALGVYVPGVNQTIPSFTVTLHDINVSNKTCVSFGVTTPAVPIHIPASALTIPGAVVETPEVAVNLLGIHKTVSGQIITVEGRTIVVPGVNETIPSLSIGTPDRTLQVNINGVLYTAGIESLP